MTTSPETSPLLRPTSLGDLALPHRIAMAPMTRNRAGPRPHPEPRALEEGGIAELVDRFRDAARRARRAGFDGVELHGANGYLVDQFLRDGTNRRTDRWGGSIENRVRFLLEVTGALVEVWGPKRVGVRLSPLNPFNDMEDSNPGRTFPYAAGKLGELDLAYLHVVEPGEDAPAGEGDEPPVVTEMRTASDGAVMLNGGYDRGTGGRAVEEGRADLVSYGKLFLANPDLPRRFAEGLPLNEPDPDTFYGGDEGGYIDVSHLGGAGRPPGCDTGSDGPARGQLSPEIPTSIRAMA